MVGTRHDMTDEEWNILQQALPKERQGPRRLQDRRVMDGIFFILRTGSPWRDRFGTTNPRNWDEAGADWAPGSTRSWTGRGNRRPWA